MPGSSVFTKRVKMARMSLEELADNIQLEAGNFIPHNINAVKLDYHILGEAGKNQMEVLVVAVKEEVVDSFMDTLAFAGLEAAVIDVDYFALQNIFELANPERVDKTVGLINVGARFSSINICSNGASLFTGDVSIGGKLFTEGLIEQLSVSADEAEQMKRSPALAGEMADEVREALEKNIEYVASEFNRQLSFFWSASGAEETIDRILIAGGGARIAGLVEEMSEKTGIVCEYIDPLIGIEVPAGFDKAYIREISPVVGVAAGLALREPGDKLIPEFME
jgi:type IV pilus assembly protein PilM